MNKGLKFLNAFTLAEVLITLAIIGVVAALTLPTLIQNHQKSVTVNSLKKFYSTMAQAKVASEAVNGEMRDWDFSEVRTKEDRAQIFDKYFRPFLNIIGECERGSGWCMEYENSSTIHPHYILNNGTIFQFAAGFSQNQNTIYILVDLNGSKGPNKMGRDVFALDIFAEYGTVMLGAISEEVDEDNNVIKNKLSSRDELINGIKFNNGSATICCSKDTSCGDSHFLNINCGALILMDGWQISSDYPW